MYTPSATGSALKIHFLGGRGGLIMTKLHDFPYFVSRSCIENENKLKLCLFSNNVFVDNLNLETLWEFIFATTSRLHLRSELITFKFS